MNAKILYVGKICEAHSASGNKTSQVLKTCEVLRSGGVFIAVRYVRDETPTYNAMRILDTNPCKLNPFVHAKILYAGKICEPLFSVGVSRKSLII